MAIEGILIYMDDQKSAQRKSLLILGGVLIITVGIGFLPAKWFGIHPATKKFAKIDLSSLNSIDDLAKDTNGDGVTDWSEIITQTYGGVEASTQTSDARLDPGAVAQLNDPNNLTGALSKDFYLSSAYLDKAGGDASPEAAQGIVANLVQQEATKIAFTTYAKSDLTIDTHETAASVKAYGNALGKLITLAIQARLVTNDVAYVKDYVDTKNQSSYAALVNKRDTARAIIAALRAQKVPLSAEAYHLLTLNRVAAYADTLDNILKVETDPIRSAIALGSYTDVARDMLRSIPLLVDYFKVKNITFSPKESGYVFDPSYTIPKQ